MIQIPPKDLKIPHPMFQIPLMGLRLTPGSLQIPHGLLQIPPSLLEKHPEINVNIV
jgi:hypothetical protein